MKTFFSCMIALFFSTTVMATPTEITCSYQWKNTDAKPNKISFKVEAPGTKKAKFIFSMNKADEMRQLIHVLKKSKHEADTMLREVGEEYSEEVFASAKDDILIHITDGVSTKIIIQLYQNTNYTAGYMTLHCDESYYGKFDFYSTLKCQQ